MTERLSHGEVVDRLRIAGASTPSYYIDLDGVGTTVDAVSNAFRAIFPQFALAYSFKTNAMAGLTRMLARRGHMAEVVSGAELDLALHDGFGTDRICFDGPLKSRDELSQAVRRGILVQVDSLTELRTLISIATDEGIRPRLTLRLATGRPGGWSRLGLSPAEVREALRLVEREGLRCLGVHFNAGAHRLTAEPYREIIQRWRRTIMSIAEETAPSRLVLDIGGGFPAHSAAPGVTLPPWSHFAEGVAAAVTEIGLSVHDVQLLVEPGRALVEDHGYLVMGVAAVKHRGRTQVLTLDGGGNLVNSLRAWHHPVTIHPSGRRRTRLYGSMCYENDVIAESVQGPRDADEHTRVVVGSCGGYDIPGARGWIRPLPPTWVRSEGTDALVDPMDVYNDLRVSAVPRGIQLPNDRAEVDRSGAVRAQQ